jgi:hypothetical protein
VSLSGAVCEFGVYKGGSLELLTLTCNSDTSIFGIDSFQGLPKTGVEDFHQEGDFSDVDHIAVAGYFKMLYPNVKVLKGYSPDVFNFFDPNIRFRFVHVDVDLKKSVEDALDFFIPRMSDAGIILFDDYGFGSTLGAKKALDTWGKGVPLIEDKQYIYYNK